MPASSHRNSAASLSLDLSLLKPGMRVAVGLSGGADSVALLRALAERSRELGLVLHAAHLHHGLRGEEADGDLEFCRELTARLEIPLLEARVETAADARANRETGKASETIEEAARRLRYAWFHELLAKRPLDAITTAHTLDDQAETVLAKFLRGAWTEGFSGISPRLECPEGGQIIRPLLGVTRTEIEAYLNALSQPWREDSSNRHLSFTRNRIRHELLPLLEGWNPRLRVHLAQMAELARDEEQWWEAELARIAPQLILPGKPVRGGGRAGGAGLAIDLSRFAALAPALQRRLLRHAAGQLGAAPDFAATEALRTLALNGRSGQKCELEGLHAERTLRELRLESGPAARATGPTPIYTAEIPGEIDAPAYGIRLRVDTLGPSAESNKQETGRENGRAVQPARTVTLRNWGPGDRARLRYSGGLRKVKEILERLHVSGSERALWPVLEFEGRVVWMKGVELEPEADIRVLAASIGSEDATASSGSTSAKS